MRRAVEMLQSRSCIAQPDAPIEVSQTRRRQTDAVVPHLELQQAADSLASNLDLPGRRPRPNAVLDGVFDERLQHKVGNQRVERVRLHVEHYRQTIAKS